MVHGICSMDLLAVFFLFPSHQLRQLREQGRKKNREDVCGNFPGGDGQNVVPELPNHFPAGFPLQSGP